MADALRVLHIVVPRRADGDKHFRVLDILHVEDKVFRPAHLAGKTDVVAGEQDAAVEFVPEHAVKIGGRLVHQPEREVVFVIHARGQEAIFPHFRGPGHGHHAQLVLQLFQYLFGFGSTCRDDHFVGRDDQVSVVLLGSGHQMPGVIRVNVVVTVHKLDVFAGGQFQAQVPGVRDAGVGLVHQNDAGILFAELFAHGQALVFGAIGPDGSGRCKRAG